MAVTLNASTSSGLVQTADTSGIIELQNNGTTKLTVNSSGATIPTAIVTTLSDGTNSTSATNCIQGSAKAWVNFDGSGGTIRGSFNVSSITVNGTGDYTLNFTTTMPNANSSVVGTAQRNNTNLCILSIRGNSAYDSITSTTARVRTTDEAGNLVDAIAVCVSVFNS